MPPGIAEGIVAPPGIVFGLFLVRSGSCAGGAAGPLTAAFWLLHPAAANSKVQQANVNNPLCTECSIL
jgi:hypothetical protein